MKLWVWLTTHGSYYIVHKYAARLCLTATFLAGGACGFCVGLLLALH